MWTRTVFISLVICFATSQPTTEENEPSRVPRQLDFGDCCPCSHLKAKNPGIRDQDALADTTGDGARFVDDCPCRRDADSHGSSSILLPTSMRSERPILRPADSKDDPKNLLQPEVGLASSVLETLRKATSEEYQEALARDAARSAAKSNQDDTFLNDGTPAESGRNTVTIILNSKHTDSSFDDAMPEASHIKEARCIHPGLGSYRSSNLGKMRMSAPQPTHLMKQILRFPKAKHQPTGLLHRNLLDMDSFVGASNVEERVVMDNNRLRNNRPMLKSNFYNNNLGKELSDNLSKVRTKSDFEDYNIRHPLVPKKRLESKNNDFERTSSDKQMDLIDDMQYVKDAPSLRLAPTENKLFQRPAILRNLLKLKDVELIPSKIPDDKFKFKFPKLRLTPLNNRKAINLGDRALERKPTDFSDLIRDGLKFNLNNRKPVDFRDHEEKLNAANSNTNIQIIPRPREDIVDTIPSPSNTNEQLESNEILDKGCNNEETDSIIERNTQNIENIVMEDTEPSPSENHPLLVTSDDRSNEAYESCETDINLNNNIVPIPEQIKLTEPQVSQVERVQNQESNEIVSNAIASEEKETIEEERLNTAKSSEECLDKLNSGGDHLSTAETNNIVKYVLPDEQKASDSTSAPLEQEIADSEEPCEEDLNTNDLPNAKDQIKPTVMKPIPLKEALNSIKENVFKTLDSLKKTSPIMKPDFSKDVKSYSLDENDKEETEVSPSPKNKEDCDSDDSDMDEAASTQVLYEKVEDSTENSGSVTTHDLQKLSDSILEASTKKEEALASTSDPLYEISEEVQNTTEKSNEENKNLLDLQTSATSQNDVFSSDVNNENTNACISNLGSSKNAIQKEETLQSSSTFGNTKRKHDEMTVEASNSILDSVIPDPLGLFKANNNLRSSLLPDIIAQPSPLLNDELNIFKQPHMDLSDIFNLKTSLPTLDDIKLQLSSIFNANERDESDEMSYEVRYDRDRATPEMATAASTSSFQSKLPSLKRLEDVNLDIFEMKPLTMTHSDLISKIPRLNLNSYRAKLAVPKTLDLKPIKLQSALGDKAGILGATLTIVPEELKVKPLLKSNIQNNRMIPDLLGNSLSIPSLDEMHETMRSNVQSLLNTPIEKSHGNILINNLRSSLPLEIPDSVRNHAENTIKDMQRTMKALKARPPTGINNLADTIKTPEDLVELASRTREDVSDKLKALHYDLNDRLTTIRESFDEPKFPSFNPPVFSRNNQKFNSRPESNFNLRSKPSTPRTLHRSNSPGRRESQNKITSPDRRKFSESKAKTFKMSPAASVPVPKSVEVPKLKSTTTTSLLPNMRREPNLKLKLKDNEPMKSKAGFLRQPVKSVFDLKKSPLNSPGPFHKDTKVTISFTTTPKPTDTTPEFGFKKGFPSKVDTSTSNRVNSLGNPNRIIKGSPNELRSSSKSIGTESEYSFRPKKPASTTSRPLLNRTKPKPTLLRHLSKDNLHSEPTRLKPKSSISDGSIPSLLRGSKSGSEISAWPNVSDNAFLSKVRETMRARLSNFKPVSPRDRPDSNRSNFEMDMARSPTENVETVLEEPLKENVSYKCRMVCTKE